MNQGLFEPTVMFFRLTNSPATFQTMMNTIFAKEIDEGWLIIYMDDILVATKDDLQFHKKCIHWMLEKLKSTISISSQRNVSLSSRELSSWE